MRGARDTISVLHVDDEPDFADLATTFLEREDDRFDTETETSAGEGLDRLSEHDFDCVISDHDMPGQNGIEFLEAVREDRSDLPFILYTGKGSEEVASEAITKGATDYLQKGSGTDQYKILANRVRNAVRQYRSTQEAKQTRRRLQTLAESTSDCVWMFDRDWEELLFVSGYEAVWNRSTEAIRNDPQDFLNGVHPEDREFVRERMQRMSNGESFDIEYRIIRGDGESGWVSVQADPVFDDEGTVTSVVGFTKDITERKQREQELRRAERRYQAILQDPNILAGVLDTDGRLIEINQTAMEYIDADEEDIIGDPFWQTPWWSKEMRPVVRDKVERATDGEYVEYDADLTYPDGDPYSVEGVIRPVTDDSGMVVSLIVSARDVTERVIREQRLETTLENTTVPLFMKNRVGEYLIVNEGFKDLFGLKDEDVHGRTDADLFPPEMAEEVRKNDLRVLETGEAIETKERIAIDGEERTFMSSKAPVYDIGTESDPDEPVAMFGVAHEITKQEEQKQRLERQNERFDELASAVAHDLQTPIETARTRAELAVETDDTEQMEQALDALERADELREDLGDVLRTREIVSETEPVDIQQTGQAAWETVSTPDDASVQLRDTGSVKADPDALRRLFENLFSNAIEHGNGEITVRIGKVDGGFFVEDNGPGIPEDERDGVFTPGYSTKGGGSGVGLASVRQIVMAQDWKIHVTEGSEGGARFEITGVEFAQ